MRAGRREGRREKEREDKKRGKKMEREREEEEKRREIIPYVYCAFVHSPTLGERESEWSLNEDSVYLFIFPKQETLALKQL